jgi:hypothetical protein
VGEKVIDISIERRNNMFVFTLHPVIVSPYKRVLSFLMSVFFPSFVSAGCELHTPQYKDVDLISP